MLGTVLSLCDQSCAMVEEWARAGYECWCVDLQHTAGERREGNIVRVGADILTWLPPLRRYAAAFAFPPCTDLAVAGAKHFRDKGLAALASALVIVDRCRQILEWTEAPYLLENPVGTLSSYWRTPDFMFNPCDFAAFLEDPSAEAYTKRTCLWTGGGVRHA